MESTEAALERLVRMETKIDLFLARMDDHEARIRRLELPTPKWPIPVAATAAILSAMVAAASFFLR